MAIPGLPQPGTTPGFSQLDAPPPSPAVSQGMSPGPPMAGLAPPLQVGQLPPEVLTGVLSAGQKAVEMIDGLAQVMPDLAPDFMLVKDALMRALAKVAQTGAGPVTPTNTGPGFPGGGFDDGGLPLASGG